MNEYILTSSGQDFLHKVPSATSSTKNSFRDEKCSFPFPLLLSFSFISWKNNINCGHFLFIWVDNRKVACGCGGIGQFQHLRNAFWLILAAAESDFLVCLGLEHLSFQITVNPRIWSYFLMCTTSAVHSSKVLSHSVVIVPRHFYKYSQIWRAKGWNSFIYIHMM